MHSLHRRLTLVLVAVLAVLITAGAGALYWGMHASLLAQFDEGLRIKALVVITGTQQKKKDLDVKFSDHFLRSFDDDIATDFYQVRVLGGGDVERSDSLDKEDLPERFGTIDEPEFWNLTLPKGQGAGRAIGLRFQPRFDRRDDIAKANPFEATVVVASQRSELDAILRRLGIVLAVGGLGLLVATSLAVPLVLRPGLRPVRQVADLAQTIDATSLEQRFPTANVPSELRPICDRLNDLLARLAASFERERRFSADLAHELLTPLAEMRAIAESALKWPETAGPEDYQRSVEILLRMEMLVTQVLELARAEHGHVATQFAPVEVPPFVQDVARSHAATAVERGMTFAFAGPDALSISTDAGVLHVIVSNLISNAVAYAPESGVIRVEWAGDKGGFELAVSNAAPQIEPEDLPRLFERFWRKDDSRTESRHSGLGLSVASELARVLGGTLTARKSTNADIVFTLLLPSAVGVRPGTA